MQQEQQSYRQYQPQQQPTKPAIAMDSRPDPTKTGYKTGYEGYSEPAAIARMEVDPSIWGLPSKKPAAPAPATQEAATPAPSAVPQASRKIMSLEEVEASMRSKKPSHQAPEPLEQPTSGFPGPLGGMPGYGGIPGQPGYPQGMAPLPNMPQQPSIDPRLLGQYGPPMQPHLVPNDRGGPPMNQFNQGPHMPQIPQAAGRGQPMPSFPGQGPAPPPGAPGPMTGLDRAAYVIEAQRVARRNHKIQQMSKDNGMMTPQDKNFVTRIQLQSLMTATGNTEQDPEAAEGEDWYYHVFSSMRNAQRGTPVQQQANNRFTQTYATPSGGRYGSGRRHNRGADNHTQRMEQQVQRAVEAAKAKPKNTQLVIEGSLGKIAYSNSKTPKPLLNIQRAKPGQAPKTSKHSARAIFDVSNRKVEFIYEKLIELEGHKRKMPPANEPPNESYAQMWAEKDQRLRGQVWRALSTHEPVEEDPDKLHPFIAILSWAKGKKLMPRLFNQLEDEQKLIILALIAVHFDTVDVIKSGSEPEWLEKQVMKEAVQIWDDHILPVIFSYISEAPIKTVTGLAGILLEHGDIEHILRTKIGVEFLTMFISRAEISRKELDPAQVAADPDWGHWNSVFNGLFNRAVPILPYLFPDDIHNQDDIYIWQFLAAVGAGSNPDQQQILVVGVKNRVLHAVKIARTLPPELSQERLKRVNLFLHAIGLDDSYLEV
jgi:DNA topoisomerase 2-associated protein PAT1